jgi:hypothetical protein
MNKIVSYITEDKLVWVDEFNQTQACWLEEGNRICTRIVKDVRGLVCPICKRGWEMTGHAFLNQIHLNNINKWAHYTCVEGAVAYEECNDWYRLAVSPELNKAGLEFTEVPNGYGGAWNTPWYKIEYKDFPNAIVVGTRKRVDQITIYNVSPTLLAALTSEFQSEKVTKTEKYEYDKEGNFYIHAWTQEKSKEYFTAIVKLARAAHINDAL